MTIRAPWTSALDLDAALDRATRLPRNAAPVSGPVRVYAPDGILRETVSLDDWATRYPQRFSRRWVAFTRRG